MTGATLALPSSQWDTYDNDVELNAYEEITGTLVPKKNYMVPDNGGVLNLWENPFTGTNSNLEITTVDNSQTEFYEEVIEWDSHFPSPPAISKKTIQVKIEKVVFAKPRVEIDLFE